MGSWEIKTEAEKEWEKKYGGMTAHERQEWVKSSIRTKIQSNTERLLQEQAEAESKEPHTYAEIVKALSEEGKKVERFKGKPAELLAEKQKALAKEYDEFLAERGSGWALWNQKAVWISTRAVEYMKSDEYLTAKFGLQDAINNFSKYTALKEDWEKNNADIIEAERMKSKRAELMQADPETLKALGITPTPTFTAPKAEVKTEDPCAIDVDALLPRFMENHRYK